MSTDIIRFQDDGKMLRKFSSQALGAYLGTTIPIMAITFWCAFYFWRRTTLHKKRDEALAELHGLAQSI
jgi:hypothetical protein